jgi:hypothetical protein
MLNEKFDCLAVPLPPSFQTNFEKAIEFLPGISAVVQRESPQFETRDWTPDSDGEDDESEKPRACSFVPIDPCQPVIAALRVACHEHIHREFIDLETRDFQPVGLHLPDAYALKQTTLDRFAAAVLPSLPRLPAGQPQDRAVWMARRLHELDLQYESILCLCSISDWPWIREAYVDFTRSEAEPDEVEDSEVCHVDPNSYVFILGELPHITGLYERAREELDDDENLSVDGVKDLLLRSRRICSARLLSTPATCVWWIGD